MLENIDCHYPTRESYFATGILRIDKDKLVFMYGNENTSILELLYKDTIAVALA
jgi:hypothetical protein